MNHCIHVITVTVNIKSQKQGKLIRWLMLEGAGLNQIGAMLGETGDELEKVLRGETILCKSSTIKLLKLVLARLCE